MGRKRLAITRIEDKSARQVTFCKRRNGLLNKAKELSILCDSDVGVIIYSSTGKTYSYCSNNSLPRIIRRYFNYVESESSSRSGEHGGQGDYSKYSEYITKDELLQVVERDLKDPGDDQSSIVELAFLESQIAIALMQTRRAKTNVHLDIISALQDEGTTLEQQNNLLEHKLAKKKSVEEPTFDLNVVPDGYTTE